MVGDILHGLREGILMTLSDFVLVGVCWVAVTVAFVLDRLRWKR